MTKSKKSTQSESQKSQLAKTPERGELSEDQLEQLAGGAVDAFLKIDLQSVNVSSETGGGVPGKAAFYLKY
jgi:hypothetical protein